MNQTSCLKTEEKLTNVARGLLRRHLVFGAERFDDLAHGSCLIQELPDPAADLGQYVDMLQVGHAAPDGHNNGLSRDDTGDQILIFLEAPCGHRPAVRPAYLFLRICQHREPSDPIELLNQTNCTNQFSPNSF